jgi:hypothetical protein
VREARIERERRFQGVDRKTAASLAAVVISGRFLSQSTVEGFPLVVMGPTMISNRQVS